jgi:uncharacterized protein (TIGR04222 family)
MITEDITSLFSPAMLLVPMLIILSMAATVLIFIKLVNVLGDRAPDNAPDATLDVFELALLAGELNETVLVMLLTKGVMTRHGTCVRINDSTSMEGLSPFELAMVQLVGRKEREVESLRFVSLEGTSELRDSLRQRGLIAMSTLRANRPRIIAALLSPVITTGLTAVLLIGAAYIFQLDGSPQRLATEISPSVGILAAVISVVAICGSWSTVTPLGSLTLNRHRELHRSLRDRQSMSAPPRTREQLALTAALWGQAGISTSGRSLQLGFIWEGERA